MKTLLPLLFVSAISVPSSGQTSADWREIASHEIAADATIEEHPLDLNGDGLLDMVAVVSPGTGIDYDFDPPQPYLVAGFVGVYAQTPHGLTELRTAYFEESGDYVTFLDSDNSGFVGVALHGPHHSLQLIEDDLIVQDLPTWGKPTGLVRDVDGNGSPDLQATHPLGEHIWLLRDEGWHVLTSAADTTDLDGDGLGIFTESELGTSWRNPDTDGDTLPDGWELEHGRDPLVADLGYFDELRTQAFPGGEPSITIARDRTVTVTGLYPVEGLTIVVQVSEDLREWRDGATAEDAVSGVLEFASPLPGGFVRLAVSEE